MMIAVAAIALISRIGAHHDRANRQRMGDRYLAQAKMHSGLVRHYDRVARNQFRAVPNCLKLAERWLFRVSCGY
jgi:hypothetical protein